jgi:hypothetical protein
MILNLSECAFASNKAKESIMLPVVFLTAALVGFALHLGFSKQPRTRRRVVEVLLMYFLTINIGFGGI